MQIVIMPSKGDAYFFMIDIRKMIAKVKCSMSVEMFLQAEFEYLGIYIATDIRFIDSN